MNNKTIDQSLLKLKNIDMQISLVMKQYKQANEEFITNIHNNNTNKNFTSLNNRTFWGTGGVEEGQVQNYNECIDMCLKNTTCTGATYNKNEKYCWARIGEGQVMHIEDTNYLALIPSNRKNLIRLDILNKKLVQLQYEKMSILNGMDTSSNNLNNEKMQKQIEINKTLSNLDIEKQKIDNLLKNGETLNRSYDDTKLEVEKSNLIYKILFIVTIIFIIIVLISIQIK